MTYIVVRLCRLMIWLSSDLQLQLDMVSAYAFHWRYQFNASILVFGHLSLGNRNVLTGSGCWVAPSSLSAIHRTIWVFFVLCNHHPLAALLTIAPLVGVPFLQLVLGLVVYTPLPLSGSTSHFPYFMGVSCGLLLRWKSPCLRKCTVKSWGPFSGYLYVAIVRLFSV